MTELEVLLHTFFSTEPESWVEEEDVVHMFGEARHVLLSLQLVCPRVVEYRGCVFLRQFTFLEDQIDEAFDDGDVTDERRSEVELSFNFVEVPHLFGGREGRFDLDEEDKVLAERLADAWRAWLPAQCPSRTFQVDVEPPEVTGSSYGIRFCVNRSRLS